MIFGGTNDMKKVLSLLLALVMVLALAACGQEKKDETPANDVDRKSVV